MKKLLALALATMLLSLTIPEAQAWHHVCCAPCIVPVCPPPMVERVVTCFRPEWKERDVTCTVLKPMHREVVDKHTCTVLVPEWKDEKRTVIVCKYVPKEIEREVTMCRMTPVCVTDACTGCTYTTCKPEYFTQKVKCCVIELVHEQREILVRVCQYKAEQRTFETRRLVCEWKEEKVTYKQRYCEMVPYQAKVLAPACP